MDICRFSQRNSETPEEQLTLMQVLSFFFTEMVRIIEDYGGVVEKNTGDGLMAYFDRQADASSQQRALAAALTMFAAADNLLNPVLIRSAIPTISFRICMDHGLVTIAKVGAPQRFNGVVAIGTTANVASKMLSLAEADTILLGSRMLPGIPIAWQNSYLRLRTTESGWFYRDTGLPYCLWEYIGRWRIPTP